MPTVNDYLGSAKPWHDRHCDALIDALFEQDEPRCRAELAGVRERLAADTALSSDERLALEYALLHYDYAVVNCFYGDAEQGIQHKLTCAALSALAPAGPLSDSTQAVITIHMLGTGVRRGFINMTEAEVDALVARIPEDDRTPNIWYYLVAWAFFNDNLRYLELALEYQTVGTTGWNDDYYWLRTNLMYLLVDGRATRLDVEKTLQGYRHPQHLADFERLFLARCEAAGLMDDELRTLFVQRAAQLEELRATVPAANPRTARVVKQG